MLAGIILNGLGGFSYPRTYYSLLKVEVLWDPILKWREVFRKLIMACYCNQLLKEAGLGSIGKAAGFVRGRGYLAIVSSQIYADLVEISDPDMALKSFPEIRVKGWAFNLTLASH